MKVSKRKKKKEKEKEKVQSKACMVITDTIQRTSREKLHKELGLHLLVERCRRNKLIFFYKILNGLLPDDDDDDDDDELLLWYG